MARKYDFISELYNRTCKTVVANPASWEAFLRSACYNYRLRFDEQLLVHAQRPGRHRRSSDRRLEPKVRAMGQSWSTRHCRF